MASLKTPTPLPISQTAQANVLMFLKNTALQYHQTSGERQRMLERDRLYYREANRREDHLRAKSANRSGDSAKLQDTTIPVIFPQVETALAELQETFLTGYPIFGTVAPPEYIDAATQMDTLIGENSVRAAWPAELLHALRAGLKHDRGAVEVSWETKTTFTITTPEVTATSGTPKEVLYSGNTIKNLDPYNLMLDPRVAPTKNHLEGEFAGYTELLSGVECRRRMNDLDPLGTMNFVDAYESASPGGIYSDTNALFYRPDILPEQTPDKSYGDFDWYSYMGVDGGTQSNSRRYRGSVWWTVFYMRVVPSDMKLPAGQGVNKDAVQIWKFIIINNQVVIFAQRQTNAHSYLPIIVCAPSADAIGWQAKSLADNAAPFQEVATSLVCSAIDSQRRKVYDRTFYDPSRINKADMDKVTPVSRIPVKNNAYGKGITDAVHVVPYRDDGVSEVLGFAQQIAQTADVANGINRVQQGQFQKGNKTRSEFATTMDRANSRSRLRALSLEYSFFTPIKEIIKANVLQYQPPTQLVNSDTKQTVKIDPAQLRSAILSFSLSDGYAPSEKMMSLDLINNIMQFSQAMPELRAQYDLMGMFTYSMKLSGANWLDSFKRTPEEIQAQLQQMQAASMATNPQPAPGA